MSPSDVDGSPVSSVSSDEDKRYETMLRPSVFKEFIGQDHVKDQLSIAIKAAEKRKEALEHVLIYGPPGLGKTTIARIIANERGVAFRQTSGPVIERRGDVAALLTQLEPYSVLFIDEIHRLPSHIEEILYPAMEDLMFDILIGEGPGAKAVRIGLQPFTLIGATTRAGMLTSPLRDRFGHQVKLAYYDDKALTHIVRVSASKLQFEIDDSTSKEIACRARGTPRIANRLLRRVRDFAEVEGDGRGEIDTAREALARLGVDSIGLDTLDTQYLTMLIEKFGGTAGLETMAAALGEETVTLEDVVEPFLIQRGFIMKTPRGRTITDLGVRHLDLDLPKTDGDLF
ncbi:MAG: Holliday junction branch migration DNA helicase RuvB [Gammaproteobacteria bacterium]|nr:Holliday junction branch migration DNA helicase RuvB [Gammaproteobacteria bacterium]